MPLGAQPHGRRGTVGHPYSALTLRFALALFGLVTSVVFAVLLLRAGATGFGVAFVVLAVMAAVDLVVILLRRRARRGGAPGGG